jgi:DNA end-binding protein Ku
MARAIWKGQISFGLVNVPVSLYSAEQRKDLSFRLLDSRDSSRIRYERINEETGEEVPWDKVVKGYEYESGNYVLLSEEELETAAPALTKTIDIVQFVDKDDIDPMYFDKPYFLAPVKGSEKGYALLRDAMRKMDRAGIAQVVIRARGHIAALMPHEEALVLELLRFQDELRGVEEFDITARAGRGAGWNKELKLAEQLITGMTGDWRPEDYADEYRAAVKALINRRIKAGDTEEVGEPEPVEAEPRTVNFMEALKESLQKKKEPRATKPRRKRSKRAKRRSKAS